MSCLALGFGPINVPPISRVPHVEVTALSGSQSTPLAVTLLHTPFSGATILVWMQGLLLQQGVDYVWTPTTPLLVSITKTVPSSPVIQVLYWPVENFANAIPD